MKRSRNQKMVTGEGISCAMTIPSSRDPNKVELHVTRHFDLPNNRTGGMGKVLRSWADGKLFDTSEQAWQFAFEHGYTRITVQAWCPHCRTLHRRSSGRREGYLKLFDGVMWRKGCKKV
jgi:hypothetical protein